MIVGIGKRQAFGFDELFCRVLLNSSISAFIYYHTNQLLPETSAYGHGYNGGRA